MPYIGVSPQFGVRKKHTYTATAGQTSFSGAGSEGVTLSYTDSNFVDVYQNGVKLGDADYTSTSGTAIVLAQGASVNDLVEIIVFDAFSAADTVSKADGGTFDGNVTMAGTLGVTGATTLTGGVSGNTTFSGEIITSTSGTSNVRIGENAGDAIASGGNYNVVVGDEAGTAITTGDSNVAMGYQAGYTNATSGNNIFIGAEAGYSRTGSGNTIVGQYAGRDGTTGTDNTLIGRNSGYNISSGSKNTIVGMYNGNQGSLDIRTSDNNIVLSDGDGNPRLRINSSGYASFSNNRAEGVRQNDAAHSLHQTTTTVVAFLESTSSSPFGMFIDFSSAAPDNNSNYFIKCEDSTNSARFFVHSSGDVTNHDNDYGAISDEKLKEQITDASSQWNDIKALKIRKFKMKEDVSIKGDSDSLWRLGVIAQEVETAGMNGLVRDNPDMIENENGEIVEGETSTKTVKYSILYMKAVKALQEAMARIETLEAKVTALENAE